MSEFLKDLLKKVKQNTDSMEAPVTEGVPGDDVILEAPPFPKKGTKPGLATKPPTITVISAKPGLVEMTEPGLAEMTEPGLVEMTKPGLVEMTKPGLVEMTEPGLVEMTEPGLAEMTEPGLVEMTEPGLAEMTKPGLAEMTEPGLAEMTNISSIISRSDLAQLFPSMHDSEFRLYCYILQRAYVTRASTSNGRLSIYSQKEAMKATGIKSTATMVKAMTSLCKKKLVKWVRKSRKLGEVSQVRVFLPSELRDQKSNSDTPPKR